MIEESIEERDGLEQAARTTAGTQTHPATPNTHTCTTRARTPSQAQRITCPSSSLSRVVRQTNGVSLPAWYMRRSAASSSAHWKTLTTSRVTYRLIGMRLPSRMTKRSSETNHASGEGGSSG